MTLHGARLRKRFPRALLPYGQENVLLLRSQALSQAIHGLVCRGRFDETRNIQERDLGRYARTRSVDLLPALCTARIAKVPGTNTRRDSRCQRESPVPNRYSMYKFLRKGTEGPPVLSRHRILHMSYLIPRLNRRS